MIKNERIINYNIKNLDSTNIIPIPVYQFRGINYLDNYDANLNSFFDISNEDDIYEITTFLYGGMFFKTLEEANIVKEEGTKSTTNTLDIYQLTSESRIYINSLPISSYIEV